VGKSFEDVRGESNSPDQGEESDNCGVVEEKPSSDEKKKSDNTEPQTPGEVGDIISFCDKRNQKPNGHVNKNETEN
jgi:hypothetical protein